MLEELMRECRNWFVAPNGVHLGTFTVKEGSIALPFLVYGQYFRIVGSVFNDGVYEYGNVYLQDETFEGAIWALSVPPAFSACIYKAFRRNQKLARPVRERRKQPFSK